MPGEDFLDDRVAAVNAVVRRPDAAPTTGDILVDGVHADLPLEPASRRRDPLPDDRRRPVEGERHRPGRLRSTDDHCRTRLGLLPHRLEVADPTGHLADDVVCLPMLDQPGAAGSARPMIRTQSSV